MTGALAVACPHCNEVSHFVQLQAATGNDGSQLSKAGNPLPVYDTTVFIPKDKAGQS